MTRHAVAFLWLCASALAACATEPSGQDAKPETGHSRDINGAQTGCIAAIVPTDCRRKFDLSDDYPFGSMSKGDGGAGGLSMK